MAHILVVDDDKDILRFVEKILSRADHTVATMDDAMKALNYLHQARVDLLITDANMPKYSGYELARALKKDDRLAGMPIAMLTGNREKHDIQRAAQVGVDAYIVKPLNPVVFIKKIDEIFEKWPPKELIEVELPKTSPLSQAIATQGLCIEAISETSMTVASQQELPVGTIFHLQSDLFKQLGLKAPLMKVQLCEQQGGRPFFRSRLVFVGPSEKLVQKLRDWLEVQVPHQRTA